MKHKYKALVVALFVICISIIPVNAAQGTIRVVMPEGMEGKEIFYREDKVEHAVKVQQNGIAVIEELPPGDYHIRVPSTAGYEFKDSEVRVPTWDEVEKRMTYDITIEPKYQKVTTSPKTGDYSPTIFYAMGAVIALGAGIGILIFSRKK